MKDNKLIAEFMGFQQTTLGWYDAEETVIRVESVNTFDTLKFDTDWRWLMAVVEKVENLGIDVHINTCVCRIVDVGEDRFEDIECFVNDNKKQAVYDACVDFIKWYNKQK